MFRTEDLVSPVTRMATGSPDSCVRGLDRGDIPAALELSSAAGWNQTSDDWATLIALAPDTCFGVDIDGTVVATASLVCYGQELAWIGMVLTRQDHRGRGFARLLVEHALSAADRKHIGTVKLDATDQGMPLYEKLNFRKEQLVERWVGRGRTAAEGGDFSQPLTLENVPELDRKASGANRWPLLKLLAARSKALGRDGSFAMQRPGRVTRYLGPCVASDEKAARKIVGDCLSMDAGCWSWDLLPANTAATRIASELGFRMDRQLTRMVRGPNRAFDTASLFAIAGFEFG